MGHIKKYFQKNLLLGFLYWLWEHKVYKYRKSAQTDRACCFGWADDARMRKLLTFRLFILEFTCCSWVGENNQKHSLVLFPTRWKKTNRKINEEHRLFSYNSSNFLSYVLSSWITQPDSVFGNMCWASWGLRKDSPFSPLLFTWQMGSRAVCEMI